MNIAVINDNHLISKLIDIGLKDKPYDIIDLQSYSDKHFDLIIVDEDMYSDDILVKFSNTKIILLSSQNRDDFSDINHIWKVFRKPFIPYMLSNLIDTIDDAPTSQILDKDEIDEIHSLLDDGSEPIDSTKEIPNEDKSRKIKNENKKREKQFLKEIFDKNITKNSSYSVLELLLNMKTKKLKKLLQNVEIDIKIRFSKDNDE